MALVRGVEPPPPGTIALIKIVCPKRRFMMRSVFSVSVSLIVRLNADTNQAVP